MSVSCLFQGRIDPLKAGRGHATPVQPVQRAKCWRLLNLEPRFEWYHVRARHNALIYRPYKETANVFLVTSSISPSVLAVWELHALSPPSAGRYALAVLIRDIWFQMPNALHRGSPRQLGLPQYSNWSVMSLFSLSNNLTFEKDLLPTSGKLLSYVF